MPSSVKKKCQTMKKLEKSRTRFTFVRNARGQTERLTKQSKGKVTENYLIYARETLNFPSTPRAEKLSSFRRADEEKWFINKQKGSEKKKNLCW